MNSNTKKLILIGGGGHCRSCIDVIEQEGKFGIVGILDKAELMGREVLGYQIIGDDNDYEKFRAEGCEFLVTVGQIKTAFVRKRIYENLKKINAKLAKVISPEAYVSQHATIGTGTIIMNNVFVNASAKVGENCILNTGCIIEHEVEVGAHTHISTGALINGGSVIGAETFIGSGAIISNQINVGNKVIVGAGTLVIDNVYDNSTVVGIPAKKV